MRKHLLAVLAYVVATFGVEVAAGFVQFTLYGALLGWVYRARMAQAAR